MSQENIRRYVGFCNDLLEKMQNRGEGQEYINDLSALRRQVLNNGRNAGYCDFIENMRDKVAQSRNLQFLENNTKNATDFYPAVFQTDKER